MQEQIITIGPDGIISGLQRKAGQGIDLRQFGPCEIKRASEIVATEDGQHWMVHLLTGPFAGRLLEQNIWLEAGLHLIGVPKTAIYTLGSEPWKFADYDEAVKVEIQVLDALRLRGEF